MNTKHFEDIWEFWIESLDTNHDLNKILQIELKTIFAFCANYYEFITISFVFNLKCKYSHQSCEINANNCFFPELKLTFYKWKKLMFSSTFIILFSVLKLNKYKSAFKYDRRWAVFIAFHEGRGLGSVHKESSLKIWIFELNFTLSGHL